MDDEDISQTLSKLAVIVWLQFKCQANSEWDHLTILCRVLDSFVRFDKLLEQQ
jgi:hypothetical protein